MRGIWSFGAAWGNRPGQLAESGTMRRNEKMGRPGLRKNLEQKSHCELENRRISDKNVSPFQGIYKTSRGHRLLHSVGQWLE